MGLEAASFINDFVTANPLGSDSKSQGDDHLRLIKTVLKAAFPLNVAARKFRDDTASAADTLDWILYRNRNGVVGDLLAGYQISGNSSTGVERTALSIQAKWLDPVNATEDSQILLTGLTAGAANTFATFDGTNGLALNPGWLKFPAAFANNTDVNTLDDYEEGTFSPTITASGGAGVTFTINSAVYTKVGNLVTCNIEFVVNNNGTGSGTGVITGLPFTSAASAAMHGVDRAVGSTLNGYITSGSTQITQVVYYSGTYPWVAGRTYNVSFAYKT